MLPQLLKDKCQRLGLSSRQAAEKVGVSHTTILRALSGDIIDLETLIKISNWLDVEPATALNSFIASPDALSYKVASVLERYPKLKDVFSKALEAIADENVEPAVIEDIVLYANYKLHIYPKTMMKS